MPTATYIPLQTITLSSSASSVTFGSIPGSYKSLVLVANYSHTASDVDALVYLRFNGDSSNGSMVGMRGNGSTTASYTQANMFMSYAGGITTTRGNSIIQIEDYSATDKHKTSLVRSDLSNLKTEAIANRWASTSAVTSIALVSSAYSFASGSTFSLYGIAG